MAILNPEHLLDQAAKLIQPPPAGKPRQVDLRRAVSAAYYAVFHAILNAIADEFVGFVHRGSREYALVLRQPDHRVLREVCLDILKSTPPAKYNAYIPAGGFDASIVAITTAFPDLQDRRHDADYNPLTFLRTSDARAEISNARAAITALANAPAADRKAFLYLLLFPPRR